MSDFYNKYPYTDFHELNLDWVIERVKKLTEDWLATQEAWNNTQEQWQQLYDYVHDYFDNLDVQDEINNKINAMITDGTFLAVVAPTINQTVINTTTAWLADHITQPTTPVIDDSLTITGAGADAKTAGQSIINIKTKYDIYAPDFELGNISISNSGWSYNPSASRVRTVQGKTLQLEPGDIISLSDYTNASFYVGWRDSNNAYHTPGAWETSDFYVTQAGDYVLLLVNNTEVTQTSKYDLMNLIELKPVISSEDYIRRVNSKKYVVDYSDFELGTISISTSGWNYINNTKRIRTKNGTTIKLNKGDIISLSDYTDAIFYVGWKVGSTYYTNNNWCDADFVAPVDGEYVVTITNITEVVLSSVYDLFKLFNIKTERLTGEPNSFNSFRSVNHQGYNSIAPNNTIPAFTLSKVMGFDYVETDIRFTSDGVPVLSHDDDISAHSTGTGNISQMTYADLLQYDFGSWKNAKYTGTTIASLDDMLFLCKTIGLHAYLELKVCEDDTQAKTIVDLVNKHQMMAHVSFICDVKAKLDRILKLDKTARVGLIIQTGNTATDVKNVLTLYTGYNDIFLDINYGTFTSNPIYNAAVAVGCDIEVWTQDSDTYFDTLTQYNTVINGITTNYVNFNDLLKKKYYQLNQYNIYSTNADSLTGGYIVKDNIVFVDTSFTCKASGNPLCLTGSPIPASQKYIPCIDRTTYEVKTATIQTNGRVQILGAAVDHIYYISGSYTLY